MLRSCPHHNRNVSQFHNIQGAKTVGQVARTIPRVYATLEDHHTDHQSTVVEVEGRISKQYVSIWIDPRSTHSYITPKIVEICAFKKLKYSKSWLVQLATRTRRKFSEIVEKCPLDMDGIYTYENLNILPLGSYYILIGMDLLEENKVKLDSYIKIFECMDEEGNLREVKEISNLFFIKHISSTQH